MRAWRECLTVHLDTKQPLALALVARRLLGASRRSLRMAFLIVTVDCVRCYRWTRIGQMRHRWARRGWAGGAVGGELGGTV